MIDVIMPVYNSGKTISRALNSLLMQINVDDLVLYIIDDCSDEDYQDIINHYSKFMTINYHKLDKNSGPGVARQYGIDHSKNEYIVFMDSDDEFVDEGSLCKLYDAIYDYDMVFGRMVRNNSFNGYFHECCLHGKMYRRSFLNDKNIRFNNYYFHEDNAFNQLYMCCSEKIKYLEENIYSYNYNSISLTNLIDEKRNIDIYIKSMNWLFENVEKQEFVNKQYAGLVINTVIMYLYYHFLENNKDYINLIKNAKYLKKMYKKYDQYLSDEKRLEIYNNYTWSIIPYITLNDFIDKEI